MRSNKTTPDPEEVIALRKKVQETLSLGITAAQKKCAEMLHTGLRSWQNWERGERKMHPAFWELALIKIENLESLIKPKG